MDIDSANFRQGDNSLLLVPDSLTGDHQIKLPNKSGIVKLDSNPQNPIIGDTLHEPSDMGDRWTYLTKGGLTDWWSDVKLGNLIFFNTGSSSGDVRYLVANNIYAANNIYVEKTDIFIRTGNQHFPRHLVFDQCYLAGTGAIVRKARIGNSLNLPANGLRILSSAAGFLIDSTCFGFGIVWTPDQPGVLLNLSTCSVSIFYRTRRQ